MRVFAKRLFSHTPQYLIDSKASSLPFDGSSSCLDKHNRSFFLTKSFANASIRWPVSRYKHKQASLSLAVPVPNYGQAQSSCRTTDFGTSKELHKNNNTTVKQSSPEATGGPKQRHQTTTKQKSKHQKPHKKQGSPPLQSLTGETLNHNYAHQHQDWPVHAWMLELQATPSDKGLRPGQRLHFPELHAN